MAKTISLEFTGCRVTIDPCGYNEVTVAVTGPDIDTILENIHKDDITGYAKDAFEPEDIFSETQLERWAEANGYVKSTDNE